MPDLEMLLRDVRPAPDPDWAAQAGRARRRRLPGRCRAGSAAASRCATICSRSAPSRPSARAIVVS